MASVVTRATNRAPGQIRPLTHAWPSAVALATNTQLLNVGAENTNPRPHTHTGSTLLTGATPHPQFPHSTLCVESTLFLHSNISQYLGFFQLSIINNVAMNMGGSLRFYLWLLCVSNQGRHGWVTWTFYFLRNCHTVFHGSRAIWNHHKITAGLQFSYFLINILIIFCCLRQHL